MKNLIWGFAPWIVYLIADSLASFPVAVGLAVVTAAAVLGRAVLRHDVHLFDVFGLVYFLVVASLLAVVRPDDFHQLERWGQAFSHGAFTLAILGSVAVGRPFTEAYARDSTPKEFWGKPLFHEINRRISLVWGLAFLAGTISLIVAGATDAFSFVLRTLIPLGALVVAWRYTVQQKTARQKARAAAPTA